MKFEMRSIQKPMFQHLLSHEKGALWSAMGSGKTSVVLYYLKALQQIDPGPALIFAPLLVAEEVWPEQIKYFDEFNHFTVSVVAGGDVKKRKAALKKKSDIYIVNYENAVWFQQNKPKDLRFKVLIIDEASRVKNLRLRKGSKRAKAIFKLSLNIKYIWELTGTPASNGMIDLWGQIGFLDKGERLGKTFTAFRNQWFDAIDRGNFTLYKPKPEAVTEISEKLKDICLTVKTEDYFDIKDPVTNIIKVPLPDNVMNIYNQMEKELFATLSTKTVTAWSKSGSMLKCLQIANGVLYETAMSWITLHNVKLKVLESIVEEAAGAPVLVSYYFRSDVEAIRKYFSQSVHINKTNSNEVIVKWNKGDIPILIGHPQSIGHGLNLQDGGNILVYYSQIWSDELRQQIFERIGPTRQFQSGHDRCVYTYDIIAKNTIDELIYDCICRKRAIQEVLSEYTKQKNIEAFV